jgi:hypothetical protein
MLEGQNERGFNNKAAALVDSMGAFNSGSAPNFRPIL